MFKIWFPRLLFHNNFEEAQATMDDFAFIFAKPESKPVVSNISDLDENLVYSGEYNPLVYQRYFDLNVRCNFKFENFPFDTQRCLLLVRNFTVKTHKHSVYLSCRGFFSPGRSMA